jgi:pimeloyl-ACP methyl ester carboxylesterase
MSFNKRTAEMVGLGLGALALAALANRWAAQRAERRHPPLGRFVEVDGTRIHYLERGSGEPLVLLHGNGSMVEDFVSSGLLDRAARSYRVIAIDRPGYGHSARPRGRIWTADRQADLVDEVLARLGVKRAIVLGHSWGTQVATALARRSPNRVAGLVLVSGYYFPSVRADAVLFSPPAIPIIGDVLRYTIAPLIGRAIWPHLIRKIFRPAPIPEKFARFPREMALRPSQLRASAAEAALLIPTAFAASDGYEQLGMPVAIVAGEGDRIVDAHAQSGRLHEAVRDSTLTVLPGIGHMVHQNDPAAVLAAIDAVALGCGLREAEARARPEAAIADTHRAVGHHQTA